MTSHIKLTKKLTKKQAIQESIQLWSMLVNNLKAKTKYTLPNPPDYIQVYTAGCPACEQCNQDCDKCPIWGHKDYHCMKDFLCYSSSDLNARKQARENILRDCIEAAKRNHIAYKHLLK